MERCAEDITDDYRNHAKAAMSSLQMINWVSFGIGEAWVQHRIEPVCDRYTGQINRVDEPATLRELLDGDCSWEMLFLGFEDGTAQTGSLESLVSKVRQYHPIEGMIVLAPAESLERQIDLMRAGADEVIFINNGADEVELAVDRTITRYQRRKERTDKEKLQLINQLAVSVNHEINNPLMGLMGTAELMLMQPQSLSDKQTTDLRTIIEQCRRIQEVTTRLKNLNHLRSVPYGAHDKMLDIVGELAPPGPMHRGGEAQKPFLPQPKILVVDDNPLIIDLIARLFDQRYVVDAAGCASDALSLIESSQYDVVLTDLILPEMNGLELFRAIRRLNNKQRVLIMTAYQGDARVEQALAEGAMGCIFKPFELEELEVALNQLIEHKI